MITTTTDTTLLAQMRRELTELRAQLLQLRCELSSEVRTRRLVVVAPDGDKVIDTSASETFAPTRADALWGRAG